MMYTYLMCTEISNKCLLVFSGVQVNVGRLKRYYILDENCSYPRWLLFLGSLMNWTLRLVKTGLNTVYMVFFTMTYFHELLAN